MRSNMGVRIRMRSEVAGASGRGAFALGLLLVLSSISFELLFEVVNRNTTLLLILVV